MLRRCDRWDFSVTVQRAVHRGVGAGVPVRLRDAGVRLPAQRPAGLGRPGGGRPGRGPTLGAAPGDLVRAVRADAPRVTTRRTGRRSTRTSSPTRSARAAGCWCAATTSTTGGAAGRRRRRRTGPGRVRVARRRGPLPGRRRPGHRLLVGDVRLRHAGPADRDLRARLGRRTGPARGVTFDLSGRAAGRGGHHVRGTARRAARRRVTPARRPRPGRISGPGSAPGTTATPPSGWSAGCSSTSR